MASKRQLKLLLVVLVFGMTAIAARADEAEDIFWNSVVKSKAVEEYEIYVTQYPEGRYVKEARQFVEQAKKSAQVERPPTETNRHEENRRLAMPMPSARRDQGQIFAVVNGQPIPKSRADALIAGQAAQGQVDSPDLRKAVMEELVRREVLTQEAMKKGFDKKPEVQGQVDLAIQGVLIGAYLNDYVRTHLVAADQADKAQQSRRMVQKHIDELRAKARVE
jgi:hypothetical protein